MRMPIDMTHYNINCGKIGRAQTILRMNVIAGDSIEGEINAFIRVNTLRRPMIIDNRLDLHMFYVPHRYVYGEKWKKFILAGFNTRGGGTEILLDTIQYDINNEPQFLSWHSNGNGVTLPLHIQATYIAIWNRFYRNQLLQSKINELVKYNPKNEDERRYGFLCNNLKTLYSTVLPSKLNVQNERVGTDGTSSNDEITISNIYRAKITKLDQAKKTYKGDQRYDQIMNDSFNTNISEDAVERPHMLAKNTVWMNSGEVDGTGNENFGEQRGKSSNSITCKLPRRRFNEHGTILGILLARSPEVYEHNIETLDAMKQNYENISCDPLLDKAEIIEFYEKYIDSNSKSNKILGYMPANQQHRTKQNFINPEFSETDTGYPIRKYNNKGTNKEIINNMSLFAKSTYDKVFTTTQLGHYRLTALNKFRVLREIGSVEQSLDI